MEGLKVQFSGVGSAYGLNQTVEADAVPREGESFTFVSEGQEESYTVRSVVWMLSEDRTLLRAYVVIGDARP